LANISKDTRDQGLILRPNRDELLKVDCYVDADFCGLYGPEDRTDPASIKSRTGHVICIAGSPVIWSSKLLEATLDPGQHTPRSKHNALKVHWFHSHLKPTRFVAEKIDISLQQADMFAVCKTITHRNISCEQKASDGMVTIYMSMFRQSALHMHLSDVLYDTTFVQKLYKVQGFPQEWLYHSDDTVNHATSLSPFGGDDAQPDVLSNGTTDLELRQFPWIAVQEGVLKDWTLSVSWTLVNFHPWSVLCRGVPFR
jgi:hypothetical protein